MVELVELRDEHIAPCAQVLCRAFREEPWNEEYEPGKVERYIARFTERRTLHGWALAEDGRVVGLALGILIPYTEGAYLRIEEFCVDPARQRRGLGEAMMRAVEDRARMLGADSVLLGTQRDYPSHRFYIKQGFAGVDTAVLLFKDL